MRILRRLLLAFSALLVALIVGFNTWGALTLGTLQPAADAYVDAEANRVVMVFGATGSAGDGLLKAAMEDNSVSEIHIVTRRLSPRIEAAAASGRGTVYLHEDFTDYSALADVLGRVNTVLWGLGTSSLKVDDALYTLIHVDFPIAFIEAWLAQRQQAPMAFHFITGMGTGAEESAHWAREKARTEAEMAALAEGTGLRTFSYRSAYIRPTTERAGAMAYVGEALLKPGHLVITSRELGQAMLEISARTQELPNGLLIDNADSIAYARAYAKRGGT